MVWCQGHLSPTNIVGYQNRLDNRTGNEINLPKCLDKRNLFLFSETITLETFINTEFNYTKPQSLNVLTVMVLTKVSTGELI